MTHQHWAAVLFSTDLLAQIEQADAVIAELQSPQQQMLTESLEAVQTRSEFLQQWTS